MLVGYGYSSSEEEAENQADDSVILGELHLPSKRKASELSTSLVPKILKESLSDVDAVPTYQANKRQKTGDSLFDVLPEPKHNPAPTEEAEEEEQEENQETTGGGLSLEDLGLSVPKRKEHTDPEPSVRKEVPKQDTPSEAPVASLSEPVVGPYMPPNFGDEYPGYEEVDPYYPQAYNAYPSAPNSSAYPQIPGGFVPYAPAPPPVNHIIANVGRTKWEGHLVDMPTEEDFINVSATALHNQSFSKTELAQKKRLEILSGKIPSKLGNKKGQLSVMMLEAERTSLLEQENRERQRAIKRETRKRYCW